MYEIYKSKMHAKYFGFTVQKPIGNREESAGERWNIEKRLREKGGGGGGRGKRLRKVESFIDQR